MSSIDDSDTLKQWINGYCHDMTLTLLLNCICNLIVRKERTLSEHENLIPLKF